MKKIYIISFIYFGCAYGMEKGSYIGCYKYEANEDVIQNIPSVQDCINNCEQKYFKFAILSNSNKTCFCNNFLGELGNSSPSEKCNENSVYYTRDSIPSPPRNFRVVSLSEENVQISWDKPENLVEITSYEITASVLHTFSHYPLQNNTIWVYSNTTFQTALYLQSASKYNLTIRAKSSEGLGHPASIIVETHVGIPDNTPAPPKILSRDGSQMTIKLFPVTNNNGPINWYRVIVLNEAAKQIFQPEYLKNYQDSLEDNLNYYIAAELAPEDIQKNFVVGDRKNYGKYFNAPLLSSVDYDLIVGIVSTFNGLTKVAYSNSSRFYQVRVNNNDKTTSDTSLLTVSLIIGIIILSILLIMGVIGFFILRRRFVQSHRHNRLSEQELTLQGPMISVENSAYLPEEQIDHYKNLKHRIQLFSLKDELSVDSHSIIGTGKFGTICKALLRKNDDTLPLAAYSIPDKSLSPEQKKMMLKNLDMLIKCRKHDNLIELIGASESSHMLYVLLKIFPMNLKQFLIDNRVVLPSRFFNVSESQILGIITQITHGLSELEKNRIIHTKLCARNIMLSEDLVPKIFGFGLADYVSEKELDYARWTALEVHKGQDFNSRSTVWSFGVLLWEICALGATPYNNISNTSELVDNISRGTRLPQLKYFNDDVYQIMLNCWQVDMGERPDCETLCRIVENLNEDTIIPFVSFNSYQMFEYEEYNPKLEFSHL